MLLSLLKTTSPIPLLKTLLFHVLKIRQTPNIRPVPKSYKEVFAKLKTSLSETIPVWQKSNRWFLMMIKRTTGILISEDFYKNPRCQLFCIFWQPLCKGSSLRQKGYAPKSIPLLKEKVEKLKIRRYLRQKEEKDFRNQIRRSASIL